MREKVFSTQTNDGLTGRTAGATVAELVREHLIGEDGTAPRAVIPESPEWVDPIEAGTPNTATMEAIRELEEGGGVLFETAEELFKDLGV